jgi:uncharacterized protein
MNLNSILLPIFVLLISVQSIFAVHPSSTYSQTPCDYRMLHSNTIVMTNDSTSFLNVWEYQTGPKNDNNKVLILAYADSGNMSQYISYAYEAVQNGFTVITFDFRGFGLSGKFETDTTMLYYNEYVNDLESVISYAKEKYHKKELGIWGFSMGSIVSVLAVQNNPVDFMAFDGAVTDIKVFNERLFVMRNKRAGIPPNSEKVKLAFENLEIPTLIFCGTKDKRCTIEDAEKLTEINSNIKAQAFEGPHSYGYGTYYNNQKSSEYFELINNLIKE